MRVRFVEGSFDDYSTTYDTDWPTVPRVGEFISITVGTGQVIDWKVANVCYVADGEEKMIGALCWIEQRKKSGKYSVDNLI